MVYNGGIEIRGGMDMPAMIAHYLFAQRVFSKLKKAGVTPEAPAMAAVGAQGPDIFFFHRVLPWEPGDQLCQTREFATQNQSREAV